MQCIRNKTVLLTSQIVLHSLNIVVHDSEILPGRELSSALFGARYRLEICAALYGRTEITASELIQELGSLVDAPSQSSISVELKRLCDAGLLLPTQRSPGDRVRRLAVVDSLFWRTAAELWEGAR